MRRSPSVIAGATLALCALTTAAAADGGSCPIPPTPDHPVQTAPADAPSVEGRNDLDAWAADEARPPAASMALQIGDVAAILDALEQSPPPPLSWWDRLLARFDAWLQRHSADAEPPAWLRDLLQGISGEAVIAILWLLLCLLVVALGGIVITELRAAGVGRRRRGAPVAVRASREGGPSARAAAPTLAQIAVLPLRDRPGALLRLAIVALTARALLPDDNTLTNGELLRLLEARAAPEAGAFRQLAHGADSAVYGAREPRPEDVVALVDALGALGPAVA